MAIKIEMLRSFLTVAEEGNIKDAATRLLRTPSAVSMTLSALEDELGGPLFEQDRKSRLTVLGTYVRDMAEVMIRDHDRGIETIDRIVTGTLDLYRPPEDRRLGREDLEDLRHLVAPEAVRRGVTLDWRVEVPDSVELGAVEVRQLLLNLLLNACAATPGGGKVSLAARTEGTDLVCDIVDQGPGLDRSVASRLTGGGAERPATEASGRRLGIDVVVALLGSLDGRATVIDAPGRGTSIRIAIPLGAKA